MKLNLSALKKTNSFLQGDTTCLPADLANVAQEYKRRISGSFVPITPADMPTKAAVPPLYVTKKLDGELAVIFFDGTDTVVVGSNGTVRSGLPCTAEAGELLKKAKIGRAIIPAELYLGTPGERERGFLVKQALGADGDPGKLCLAPFDIIELDGTNIAADGYGEVHATLEKLFGSASLCKPVPMKKCASSQELSATFEEWVTVSGVEGIVLRSTLPIIYKVKPRHTIDVAIIGFTEGDGDNRGKLREILFALQHENGMFQVIGKTGNGFSVAQKADLFALLSGMPADSSYIETDSRNVAFKMVQPKLAVEIGFSDILTESASGERKQNPMITFDESGYIPSSPCKGISMLHAVFERLREDKQVDAVNTGISQLTRLVGEDAGIAAPSANLTASTVLRREVYTKGAGEKLMVQKYLVWKTNKEALDGRFPAYVLHYSDFSAGRKEMLKRELRVSSSEEQILALCDQMIAENVKKGWEPYSS
jgi:hypothetical protein